MTSGGLIQATLPGLAFAAALAIVAKVASYATGGAISAVLCAILLGVLWRNVLGVGAWAERGLEFAGQSLLRAGIALIGLRLTLAVLGDVSLMAVPVVLSCVAVAITAAIGIGRLLGVAPVMRQLLAAGTAICGCTAIIAVAPLLHARKADIGVALTCVVLFGSMAMIGYPWLAGALFDAPVTAGMFFGASIHDTSQVVGASLIYAQQFGAPEAVPIAGLTKFMRTLGLLLLVPLAAWWGARGDGGQPAQLPQGLRRKAVPAFVLFFIGFVVLRTLGDGASGESAHWLPRWQQFLALANLASEWLLLCGMAAVGLGVTVSHLREAGWRPILLSFLAALLTGLCALLWCLVVFA
ncbi:MAG: putative sulfate exporter family transporter [Gammaproteobacteria bacterium]|nr:putative sulfate exporter family transporter [Gammaproteobacteria bacterium]